MTGASHAVFKIADTLGWRLFTCDYVLREVERNLRERLSASAGVQWQSLRPALAAVKDELTFPWPVVFSAAKDRPVLFTAAATAEVLLTLDRSDFGAFMESGFYGMAVMKPGDFLLRERKAGRLKELSPPGHAGE